MAHLHNVAAIRASYLAARLKRDHPAIVARIEAGELL